MYCYLKNYESMQTSFLLNHSQEMLSIWQHILNHVKLEVSEWSLWIIFLGFKQDYFFQSLYSGIDIEYRLLILDILLEFFEDECKTNLSDLCFNECAIPPTSQVPTKILPNDCLIYLANQFKVEIENFLHIPNLENAEMFEDNIRLACKLSALLRKVTSIEGCIEVIQREW